MPTKYCSNCRNMQPVYARFCNLCGRSLPSPVNPAGSPIDRYAKQIIGGAIIAAAVGLLVMISVAFVSPTGRATSTVAAPPASPLAPASAYTSLPDWEISGKVVAVADGDTVTVLDADEKEHKIRIAGIDAPESGQDFGNKAKMNLSALLFGKTVKVVGDKIDKYGRRVGKVILDGRDIGLEQIKAGYAWHYKEYASEQSAEDAKTYAAAEENARRFKVNIWAMRSPTPPWDYRKDGDVPTPLYGKIFGNRNGKKYHWLGCPGFSKIAERNRVVFDTWQDAEAAGYKAVTNCSTPRPGTSDPAEPPPPTSLKAEAPTPRPQPPASAPLYSPPPSAPRRSGLIRGPRGGCYYINSRGNKTYVDRSLCD